MPNEHPAAPRPEALVQPLRRLLRPLVRLCMRSGVTFPVLADLLRGLYVDVAANDVLTDAKERTDSRISLLTGVHRKEIRRLRSGGTYVDAAPQIVTVGSQIVARWLVPPWCDAEGVPRPLPRHDPAEPLTFEHLVESVTTDVRPRAVLDDLVEQGTVSLQPDDMVRLDIGAFIPRQGGAEQLFFFARNLHDHIAASVANVLEPGAAPFLDRSVHYDRMTHAAARRLEDAGRVSAQRLLVDINHVAASEADSDPLPDGARGQRVNIGVYIFVEDERDAGRP